MKILGIIALFSLTLGISCLKPPHKPNSNGGLPGGGRADGDGVPVGTQDGMSPQALTDQGSALRFADSWALSEIYERVFGKQDYGFRHCEKDKPRSPSDCDNAFKPENRPDMGTFDIILPGTHRGPNNKQAVTSLKLSYIRSLREMLVRECRPFIAKEMEAMDQDQASENIFVSERPTAAGLENYMRRLLGVEGTTMAIEADFESYAKALQESLAAAGSDQAKRRDVYVNACVTVSMDPIVFLY